MFLKTRRALRRMIKRRARPVLLASAATAAVVFAASWFLCPPPLEEAKHYPAGFVLRDADGEILRVGLNRDGGDCRPAYAANRKDWIVKAAVAAEDQRFFSHHGVDFPALARAFRQNLTHARRVSGASTLTMQTVRLIKPRPRTLWSKYVEAFQAARLECAMPKDEILAQYLNRAPFGSNLVGIEAAAQGWFGKRAAQLSLGEAALLAGVVQSPARFRPDRNLQAALKRRAYVFDRMQAAGFITAEQRTGAESAPVVLCRALRPFRHPHFCDWVASTLPARTGDIPTPLTPRLQVLAEAQADLHATRSGCDVAVVIVDVRRNRVVALACSGDYAAPGDGRVNTATAARSAGSTLKPFLVALALDRGLVAPGETLADVPRHYGNFSPANFDGAFRGMVRAEDALVLSLNLPFIDLVQQLGVEDFATGLRTLGLHTLNRPPGHYGLGLAIGNAPVRLVDLALAYTKLARAASGEAAEAGAPFSTPAAWLVSDMLSGSGRSEDAIGHLGDAAVPRFAWKTGTSSDFRDAWAVAWNPGHVVAVWCGSKNGRKGPLWRTGSKTAAPLAWAVLRTMYPSASAAPWFARPPEVHYRRVCALSGKPPSRYCGETFVAAAIAGTSAEALCSWHRPAAAPGGTTTVVYPPGIAAFLKKGMPQSAAAPRIVHPASGTVFKLQDASRKQSVAVKLEGVADAETVWWFVDAVPAGTSTGRTPWLWALVPGAHTLTAATAAANTSVSVRVE